MKKFILLVSIFCLGLSSVASGAKPVPVEPSITLNESNPSFQDLITFTTVYPPEADRGQSTPRIWVDCYQNGSRVYAEGGGAESVFKLGGDSSIWVQVGGGPANCVAVLHYFTYKQVQEYHFLAQTEFQVGG